jgi:hypothetical protein
MAGCGGRAQATSCLRVIRIFVQQYACLCGSASVAFILFFPALFLPSSFPPLLPSSPPTTHTRALINVAPAATGPGGAANGDGPTAPGMFPGGGVLLGVVSPVGSFGSTVSALAVSSSSFRHVSAACAGGTEAVGAVPPCFPTLLGGGVGGSGSSATTGPLVSAGAGAGTATPGAATITSTPGPFGR